MESLLSRTPNLRLFNDNPIHPSPLIGGSVTPSSLHFSDSQGGFLSGLVALKKGSQEFQRRSKVSDINPIGLQSIKLKCGSRGWYK
ncbi:hypothetical protein VNO77_37455 [Canavalia gladiata]|uniref:Uncharacterized protein n=1 Tax=Canavalia gladiata TaxID=3824 RepID=A0AAN9KAV5_CANGL